jgi:hypothetical protein
MQVYQEAGNIRNITIFSGIAIAIALVSIYGTRLVGLFPSASTRKKLPVELLIFFIPVNFIFIFLGLFTMQESGGLNTFNFFIVPIVSLNIFAALSIASLPKKSLTGAILLLIVFTLPRSIQKFSEIIQSYQGQKTSIFCFKRRS